MFNPFGNTERYMYIFFLDCKKLYPRSHVNFFACQQFLLTRPDLLFLIFSIVLEIFCVSTVIIVNVPTKKGMFATRK